MGIIFNNTSIDKIIYNNITISKVIFNNSIVYETSGIYNYPSYYKFIGLCSDYLYFLDTIANKVISIESGSYEFNASIFSNNISSTFLYPTATEYGICFGSEDSWGLSDVSQATLEQQYMIAVSEGDVSKAYIFKNLTYIKDWFKTMYIDDTDINLDNVDLLNTLYDAVNDRIILYILIDYYYDIESDDASWTNNITDLLVISCEYNGSNITDGRILRYSPQLSYYTDEPGSEYTSRGYEYINPYKNIRYFVYRYQDDNSMYTRQEIYQNNVLVSSSSYDNNTSPLFSAVMTAMAYGYVFTINNSNITIAWSPFNHPNGLLIYIINGVEPNAKTILISYEEFPNLLDKSSKSSCRLAYDNHNIYFINPTKHLITKIKIDFESYTLTI